MSKQPKTITRGDVIQITPHSKTNPKFYGKLAIVDEVRNWGVIAFVDTFEGKAYIRLPQGTFERVGEAPFLPEGFEQEKQEQS